VLFLFGFDFFVEVSRKKVKHSCGKDPDVKIYSFSDLKLHSCSTYVFTRLSLVASELRKWLELYSQCPQWKTL